MHASMVLYGLSALTLTAGLVPSPLTARAIGGSCKLKEGSGTCQNTSDCTTQGFNLAGACDGPADIQCCVKQSCDTPSGSGTCLNKPAGEGRCGGSWVPGHCPGDEGIMCCVSGASPPPTDPAPPGGSGQPIVDAAVKEEGLPYVWGGGDCDGPSEGGFDCSGLTQYAICQAGHGTIPRTAQTQYHSDMGKHIPRDQAQPGDLVFWGGGGDCVNDVQHVGIVKGGNVMVNAAHTGTPVREQEIWTSSGGESICDDAVRFW